jgi:hypothetical protein
MTFANGLAIFKKLDILYIILSRRLSSYNYKNKE